MTDKPPAGHESPEQRTAMEEAFSRLTRAQGSAGPTGDRIAAIIRDRQSRRREQSTTDTDSED